MSSNGVIYEYNKSSVNDLFIHLYAVDNDYAVRLSDRTDIKEYAQKLFEKSERIEAWENDVLVGLVAYYNNQVTNSVYVSDVSVKKKFRSYGIASNLLNRLKDNVIKNNITKIVLEADDSLGDFYVKNGFTIGKRISDRSHEMEYYKDDKDIMVSICCLVYNHEPYLRQCFDGFVMQKTNFPIEILVHDDASTDHSADIIREYTEKYPDLFKPIYQTENQYSKGIKISLKYQFSRARGKYIAMCEGDDYWTDPLKLQKQVDFLEEHGDCCMTCSRVDRFSESKQLFIDDYGSYEISKYVDPVDIIEKGGLFISTCSIVFRHNILKNYPEYCIKCHVGDYPIQIIAAMKGSVFYINDIMAVYRVERPLSWVGNLRKGFLNDKYLAGIRSEVKMLQCLCSDYPLYKKNFENRINIYVFSCCPNRKQNPQFYSKYKKEFKKEIRQLGLKNRIDLFFKTSGCKRLYYVYKWIKSKL